MVVLTILLMIVMGVINVDVDSQDEKDGYPSFTRVCIRDDNGRPRIMLRGR